MLNRWSSKKEAVQEIGGISMLALKGLCDERMANRWISGNRLFKQIRDISSSSGRLVLKGLLPEFD
jgi:hypothetical protein